MRRDLPARARVVGVASTRVDRDDDALRAEFVGARGDDLRMFDRRGVQRDLVGARAQHAAHVLDAAHPTADGERDEHLVGDALDRVHHRVAIVGRCRDVEEHQLVGAFRVVARRELDRITGVAQLGEPHAFHDAARVDVETWDHADSEHAAIPSSMVKRPS